MRQNREFLLLTLLLACLHTLRASQDVDGTIVWVDNDKKEKDITLSSPTTFDVGEIKYWKYADNRLDNGRDIGLKTHDKGSNGMAMFVGNEDTPEAERKHHQEEPVESSNTVDAHYITASDDEEHVDVNEHQDNEGETHGDGVSVHYNNPSRRLEDSSHESIESSNSQSSNNEQGTEMEADEDDEGKNLVSSDKEQVEAANSVLESLADDHSEREIVSERGDTKATIQKHHDNNKDFNKNDIAGNTRSLPYDGLNVKKDHGVGETANDNFGDVLTRNSMGGYAPDDNDITDIVSRFTDNKSEERHQMGKDELQMHLDDEALKMEVKAIEEEDSNVKNVLQGAEKFANGQKLGRFEGDFEKDLIKDIGKDKVEVDDDNNRNKNSEDEAAEDNKREEEDRDNENEDEDDEQRKENSQEHRKDDESAAEKSEDENGERKHLISTHKEHKQNAPGKIKHRKYRLFGGSTRHGAAITDSPDWRVDFDNEAMETEVKAIEDEDAKVTSALEGVKLQSPNVIDEYKYDSPKYFTAEGHPIRLHHHRAAKKHLTGKLLDENIKDKMEGSDKEQTESSNLTDSKVTDEISEMLQETTAVLSQTDAMLNESLKTVSTAKSLVESVSNATEKPNNETDVAKNSTSIAQNVNATLTNTSAMNPSQTTNMNNKTSDLNMINNNKTIESNYDNHSNSSSSDGKEKKITTESPSKRDLKKEEGSVTKKFSGRRHSHKNKKLNQEQNRAVALKNNHKHTENRNKNYNKQKYSHKELQILKLMYPSLVSIARKKKSHKRHKQKLEKRFIKPTVTNNYRRFKKQRNYRREELPFESGEKHVFRRPLAIKKPTVSKERYEQGRRREEVQKGMTGAISYTNRDGNEFMFAVSRDTLTWPEASSKCQSIGGELVSIGDKEEQEFIKTNVIPEKGHYWIGFTDQESEGIWQWKDKTPVRYTNWNNLEPDDGNIKNGEATHNEDCAVINPTMDWSDLPCWNRFQFICKLSPDNGRAISFGGTMSHSDVGNKQHDSFAEGLKNKPKVPTKKPIKENNPKTREKTNEMKKGYSGQGPSRGGYKTEEQDEPAKIQQPVKANSAMVKGNEAGVPGGAEASVARTSNALAQATANSASLNKPVKSPAPAAMNPGKYVNAGGGGGIGPGTTGLGSVPGVTSASFNGNGGLAKIGGATGGGGQSAVQAGGKGGQSATNMAQQGAGNQGGAANMAGGPQGAGGNGNNAGNGGVSNNARPAGANGGAPGHVAANGGLAQAPNGGAPAGGGNALGGGGGGKPGGNVGGGGMPASNAGGGMPAGNNAGGGRVPAGGNTGGGGMPAAGNAGGGGMPAAGNAGGGGIPAAGNAGGGGMPAAGNAGGGGMPAAGNAGGGGMPATNNGGGAPAGTGNVGGGGPAVMQAPAGGTPQTQAPQNNNAGGQGGGSSGTPELSPLQAKVAQQLANVMAPQLEKEYASKFEPEMEMMKTICGKLCADVSAAMPNDDPEKIGKACGGICARSLLKKSPEEAMDLLIGLAKGAKARPTTPVVAVPTGAIPVPVPVNNGAAGGGQPQGAGMGNNGGGSSGNGGTGGASNNAGGSSGGSNGGGASDGGGGGSNGGNGASNNGGGNGNNFQFSNGNPVNLEQLGANLAPKLGLSIKGDGKVAATDGESLKEKVTEVIDSLKNEKSLKTGTASKSILPGRRSKHKTVPVKGYYTLKKTKDTMASPTKKHKMRHAKKKHPKKSKKSMTGSKRRMIKKREKEIKHEQESGKKIFIMTL